MRTTPAGAAIPPAPTRRPQSRTWRRGPAVVTEVSITIAPQLRIGVDVADPTTFLSVHATEHADAGELDTVAGPGAEHAWTTWTAAGDDTALRNLTLTAPWVRRMVTESIRAHRPTPVDEAILTLDEALADIDIDNSAAAARAVAWCVDELDPVVDAAEDGALPETVAVLLEDTLRRASEPVAGTRTRRTVDDLLGRLAERESITDDQLDTWLTQIAEQHTSATHLGFHSTSGHASETGVEMRMVSHPVDLAALPPRILRWDGARTPEIFVEATGQFVAGGNIEAQLHVTAEDADRAEDSLYAYAADVTAGTILSITRLTPVPDGPDPTGGHTLTTTLQFRFPQPTGPAQAKIEYGVFHTDTGPGKRRTGTAGLALAAIDRLMIDAWSTHREAVTAATFATLLGQEQNPNRIASLLDDAADLAEEAEQALNGLARRAKRSGAGDIADRLNAHATAIAAYRTDLSAQPATPEQRPLTCEIVAATWKKTT